MSSLDKRIALTLMSTGPLASLAVSPFWNYDPINLIKLLFICSSAFYCFGILTFNFKLLFFRVPRIVLIGAAIFLSALISSLLFSGAPISQQFWGMFGRNTGFLTYFALLILLIAAAFIRTNDFYKSIVNSLVITSIPMTLYCLIQVAGHDPIGWSEKHAFGTLGNINFSSAFFGLSTICSLAIFGEKSYSKTTKLLLLILVFTDLAIVLSTNSIQGLMMFVAGAGIQGFIFIKRRFNSSLLNFGYISIGILISFVTIFGLANKGPLAKLLFAPSIVFRTDYWHAGWVMTLKNPFFGVGLDSYGDWYRTFRGQLSTLRTGPDRISNTAHNIFLDLSSNGGIPLIFAYFLLLFIAFRNGLRFIKNNPNSHSIALFTSWIGFIIFSSISIAQVGVGIWGWLFTGTLIGLPTGSSIRESEKVQNLKNKSKKQIRDIAIQPGASLMGFTGFLIGFVLSYLPFQADTKYKSAIQTSSLDKIIKSVESVGSTAFHKEMVIDLSIKNNFADQARALTLQLNEEYPRDFLGWKALYVLSNSSPSEKAIARSKLKELDPFNPDYK